MENNIIFKIPRQNIDESLYKKTIDFLKVFPDAYIGGSFALNAFGLLNRYINDIDICINKKYLPAVLEYLNAEIKLKQKNKNPFLADMFVEQELDRRKLIKNKDLSDDGFGSKHIHFYLDGVKLGVFFVDADEPIVLCGDEKEKIKLSLPDKAIKAKEYYVNRKTGEGKDAYPDTIKHKNDLEIIYKNMEQFNRKMFLFYT